MHSAEPEVAALGPVVLRTDIQSSMGPFNYLPGYRVRYPEPVTAALANLFSEYNRDFNPLVAANREWETDYQHGMTGPDGLPVNYMVQIDMVGLPDTFLRQAASRDEKQVREVLRGGIFEIENSLAMYQLIKGLFAYDAQKSYFGERYSKALDALRHLHDKPVALLAVTDQKYQAMKESEFGKQADEPLEDEEVMQLSGFDTFFGPREFLEHLEQNGGRSDYLLYVRSSDPVAKLKKPNTVVENPLLVDPDLRRVIKANAVTFNIDNPEWPVGDPRRINDTKAYLHTMGMAFVTHTDTDHLSPEFVAHLLAGKAYNDYSDASRLSSEFASYLRLHGIDPVKVESGDIALRAKPMQGTYGCYGHISGALGEKRFRQELRQNMRSRGSYVIQPEMPTPTIINEADGSTYTYIDRNFFSTDGKTFRFMGGFRSLMPVDSTEAHNGRNHGSASTVWAEII